MPAAPRIPEKTDCPHDPHHSIHCNAAALLCLEVGPCRYLQSRRAGEVQQIMTLHNSMTTAERVGGAV